MRRPVSGHLRVLLRVAPLAAALWAAPATALPQSIAANGVPVPIDHTDGSADFHALIERARSARIVHLVDDANDAANVDAFHDARGRIIEELARRAGYSVLVIPVGIFEGAWLDRALRQAQPVDAAAAPLYRVWRENPAFLRLLGTLGRLQADVEFEMIGGLSRYHAVGKSLYSPHLLDFVAAAGPDLLPAPIATALETHWGGSSRLARSTPDARQRAAEFGEVLLRHFASIEESLVAFHGAHRVELEFQQLRNFKTFVQLEQIRAGDIADDGGFLTREKRDNLLWFLETRYPGRRIVYWEGRGEGDAPLITDAPTLRIELTADAATSDPVGAPPAELLGAFEDDYGLRYRIDSDRWVQEPNSTYHVELWSPSERFLIARNDIDNPADGGLWTRIDWLELDMPPYSWAFCLTEYGAPSAAAAAAVETADRAEPRTGCGGFPFSRMRRLEPAVSAEPRPRLR